MRESGKPAAKYETVPLGATLAVHQLFCKCKKSCQLLADEERTSNRIPLAIGAPKLDRDTLKSQVETGVCKEDEIHVFDPTDPNAWWPKAQPAGQ